MTYIHEDPEFGELVQIVAQNRGLGTGPIEKDYWVTHSLWALSRTRMEIWFKEGTSLSKGFNLIERFSEDLDLRIEGGGEEKLSKVTNWKSSNKGPVAERRAFYEALEQVIAVPGSVVQLDREQMDKEVR
ncbi:MAG TPA: nucleotidyl transferase AbiEii/AbiGii toxin family protein [Bdellovibrionota bacterium]|nr:nucleotidyl transferase AbiEii/AbiGii toxin family protein [Bdellovibrionota bacterium]